MTAGKRFGYIDLSARLVNKVHVLAVTNRSQVQLMVHEQGMST